MSETMKIGNGKEERNCEDVVVLPGKIWVVTVVGVYRRRVWHGKWGEHRDLPLDGRILCLVALPLPMYYCT